MLYTRGKKTKTNYDDRNSENKTTDRVFIWFFMSLDEHTRTQAYTTYTHTDYTCIKPGCVCVTAVPVL